MKNRMAWVVGVLAGTMCGSASAQGQAKVSFGDVPSGHAASAALTDLKERGLISGYPDGTFHGRQSATRGEVCLVLYRLVSQIQGELAKDTRLQAPVPLSSSLPQSGPFADVPPNWESEMGDAVAVLTHLRVLNGYPDQTLALHRPISGGEFTALLQRILRWVDRELSEIDASHGIAQPKGGTLSPLVTGPAGRSASGE
jgi:hypothetical protein